ncbi:MAG: redoxin domain-containing protein [Pseudomonadota bacterium]
MLQTPAKEWTTQLWFNTDADLSLASLRGQVVVLYAFQMLCPGCVSHGIPQAKRVHELFRDDPVSVIGMHSVFEHPEAMTPVALKAFIHEYRITFPVAVDQPPEPPERMPRTMRAYDMQGTPSTLLFDAAGMLRRHVFGVYDDLALGRDIGQLVKEANEGPGSAANPSAERISDSGEERKERSCDDSGCLVPQVADEPPGADR